MTRADFIAIALAKQAVYAASRAAWRLLNPAMTKKQLAEADAMVVLAREDRNS